MINLVGDPNAGQIVIKELIDAKINVIVCEKCLKHEVSVPFAGQYRSFSFVRAWYYWVVTGKVPLEVAKVLYNESGIGKEDIRVVGHCGCPPPEKWVTWFDDEGRELVGIKSMRESESFRKRHNLPTLMVGYHAVPKKDFPKYGKPYITLYHIDSQSGLNLFVETLKRFNID